MGVSPARRGIRRELNKRPGLLEDQRWTRAHVLMLGVTKLWRVASRAVNSLTVGQCFPRNLPEIFHLKVELPCEPQEGTAL
jgi:hypothetical protein